MIKNAKKRQSMMIGFLIAFMMISVGLFTGCTSNNTNPSDNTPIISDNDLAVLRSAYNEYDMLRQNTSAKNARQQLIQKINTEYEGVENAHLGIDNYSIFIKYSAGGGAIVDTYESEESTNGTSGAGFMAAGGNSYDDYLSKNTLCFDGVSEQPMESGYTSGVGETFESTHQLSFDAIQEKITPNKKKMLILSPSYYDSNFPTKPWNDTIDWFKAYGWTDDDIVIKVVDRDPATGVVRGGNILPEDYFSLDEYGIILFAGHGSADKNFNEDNLYLQFCFFSNKTLQENSAIKQELTELYHENKIFFADEEKGFDGATPVYWLQTFIRADLLRENIDTTLPGSYIYLNTCYGGYFNRIFLDKDAKIFLGYEQEVHYSVSYGNMLAMNTLLLEKGYSVHTAFLDDMIKSTSIYDPDPVYLHVYPNPNSDPTADMYYFPAWINLTVTSIPSGTSYITSSLYDSSSTLIGEAQDTVNPSDIQIECEHLKNLLAPSTEEVTVKIKAYNSGGQEFASGEKTVTLFAGGNPIQIALTESGGLTIEFDAENGQLDIRKSLYQYWFLMMEAKLQNPPNGDILYVWDNLGDSSLGGFNMNKEQHLETDDYDTTFYSSGNGTDGQKIPITCTAYLVKEDGGRELLASGSAEIEVYYPTQIYEICGPDSTKAPKFGSDSTWDFIHVDHERLYGNQFYARKGDQLQVICSHAGTMYEGFDYDIYIRVGKTSEPPAATQLIVSESEIVDGLNKIVTIDI